MSGLLFPLLTPNTAVYAVLAVFALVITLPFALKGPEDLLVFAASAPVFWASAVTMFTHEEPRFAPPQVLLYLAGAIGAVLRSSTSSGRH